MSEEELRQRVKKSIEDLVPSHLGPGKSLEESQEKLAEHVSETMWRKICGNRFQLVEARKNGEQW